MMPGLIIRSLIESDVSVVAAWVAETPLWIRYGVTAERAAAQFRRGLAEDAHILAGQQGERVVGFTWVVPRGAFDRSAYLRLFGVHPAVQKRGTGTRLLMAAEEDARTSAREMILLCSDFNTDAQRFYERHGYRKVGELPDYVMTGTTEVIYKKNL